MPTPRNPFWERRCDAADCKISAGAFFSKAHGGLHGGETPDRQLALAEEDFREYLSQVFFAAEGAAYFILEEAGRYVSALRLEPYEDGLLLEALETAPEERRKGYAAHLICETVAYLKKSGPVRLYSHVLRGNTASLRTHEKCGFRQISDCARYIDGSVNRRAVTMLYTEK